MTDDDKTLQKTEQEPEELISIDNEQNESVRSLTLKQGVDYTEAPKYEKYEMISEIDPLKHMDKMVEVSNELVDQI